MQLTISNIRGFAGDHTLDIKPLTVLVGENSSGKSTLLAAIFTALQSDFPNPAGLNRQPFELGSFETIATHLGARTGRATTFSIGWKSEGTRGVEVIACYEDHSGLPRPANLKISADGGSVAVDYLNGIINISEKGGGTRKTKFDTTKFENSRYSSRGLPDIWQVLISAESQQNNKIGIHRKVLELLFLAQHTSGVTAIAPLRTRPRRTYDNLIEDYSPEGDHVPLKLANAMAGNSPRDEKLRQLLNEFGRDAGLFRSLTVKRKGKKQSDPFQIRIKTSGPDANLIDVGYGVSQALPVIVDSITTSKDKSGKIVLVQQPEVHLHPKAQAALGTFFSKLAKEGSKHFVIETHSDHLVDRIRIAIAEGIIKNTDVNLVFVDKDKSGSRIHPIKLDRQGTLVDAPNDYRKFFLEENLKVLFRGKNAPDN